MSRKLLGLLQLEAYKRWSASVDVISLQNHTIIIMFKVKIKGVFNFLLKQKDWLNIYFFWLRAHGDNDTGDS